MKYAFLRNSTLPRPVVQPQTPVLTPQPAPEAVPAAKERKKRVVPGSEQHRLREQLPFIRQQLAAGVKRSEIAAQLQVKMSDLYACIKQNRQYFLPTHATTIPTRTECLLDGMQSALREQLAQGLSLRRAATVLGADVTAIRRYLAAHPEVRPEGATTQHDTPAMRRLLEHQTEIQQLLTAGVCKKHIAAQFNTSIITFNKFLQQHPELLTTTTPSL